MHTYCCVLVALTRLFSAFPPFPPPPDTLPPYAPGVVCVIVVVVAAVLAVVAGHVGDGAARVHNQAELLRWRTKGEGGIEVTLTYTVGMG